METLTGIHYPEYLYAMEHSVEQARYKIALCPKFASKVVKYEYQCNDNVDVDHS